MNIKFPKLSISQRIGKRSIKNLIKHLIQDEVTLNCQLVSQQRTSYILKDDNKIEYYVTSKKNQIPSNYKYVLLTTTFNTEDLNYGKIILQKWLKHPDLRTHSPSEILVSWNDSFKFKEEDPENNILGLRTPQLGAIHSILGHLTIANDIAVPQWVL